MNYHFKIHKEDGGFWAECIELPGCFTQADTREELLLNMQQALNLYIEEPSDSKELACLPDDSIKKSKTIVQVALDPNLSFSLLIKHFRIKYKLTQKEAAKKMGFDKIYSYQRLEAGKCNPSLKMLSKIKQIFPEFSIDYAISNHR